MAKKNGAEQLGEWPEKSALKKHGRGSRDWDSILNGKVWRLPLTETTATSLRSNAHQLALMRGLKVKTAVTADGQFMIIQAAPREPKS
jgi:hypothetical protein